jgi:hypothetical protein
MVCPIEARWLAIDRADLTALQRKEQIAEWISLTDEKNNSGRTPATIHRGPGRKLSRSRRCHRRRRRRRDTGYCKRKAAKLNKVPGNTFAMGDRGCLAAAGTMCEKCVELDGKIEHYQRMASRISDPAMLAGIKELIEGMKSQKAALHPEQEQ